jgi:hypothetical protein
MDYVNLERIGWSEDVAERWVRLDINRAIWEAIAATGWRRTSEVVGRR